MKKSVLKSVAVICFTVIMTVLCALPIMASGEASELPDYFWPMDEQQFDWVGENVNLDMLEYSDYYEATEAKLYNAAWAGRYGGVSIIAKDLEIAASSEKNRFLVVNVMPDYDAIENQFDKFTTIYWKTDDPKAYHFEDAKDAFSVLYHAQEEQYQKVIIDLNWQEEISLETLRLEIFSSSYETSAEPEEGYKCGLLYFQYIALFDTLEEATNFVYKVPEQAPTQAPTNEPGNTQEPTDAPSTKAPVEETKAPSGVTKAPIVPDGDENTDKKSPIVGIVIGVVVVILIAVLAIVLIIKPKKK